MINSPSTEARREIEFIESSMGNALFHGNIKISKLYGLSVAVFLEELISKSKVLRRTGKIEDGWFFYQQSEVASSCGLSANEQTRAYKCLEKNKVVAQKRKGFLPQKFFKIDYCRLKELLSEELPVRKFPEKKTNELPGPYQRGKLALIKGAANNNNINIDINTNINSNDIGSLLRKETNIDLSLAKDGNQSIFDGCYLANDQQELPTNQLPPPAKPSVRKFNRSPYTPPTPPISNPPKTNIHTGVMNATKRSISQIRSEKRLKNKNKPAEYASDEILVLMEHWKSLGFKTYDPYAARVGYNKTVNALKDTQNGRYFNGDKTKYAAIEIEEAMNKFALEALDPNYGPDQSIKDKIAKFTIPVFLKHPKSGFSYFLKMLREEPKKKKSKIVMEEPISPGTTERFMKHFMEEMRESKDPLDDYEKSVITKSSNELAKLYKDNDWFFLSEARINAVEISELLFGFVEDRNRTKDKLIKPWVYSWAMPDLMNILKKQYHFAPKNIN